MALGDRKSAREITVDFKVLTPNGHHFAPQYSNTGSALALGDHEGALEAAVEVRRYRAAHCALCEAVLSGVQRLWRL